MNIIDEGGSGNSVNIICLVASYLGATCKRGNHDLTRRSKTKSTLLINQQANEDE
jgi:hypothetical protein